MKKFTKVLLSLLLILSVFSGCNTTAENWNEMVLDVEYEEAIIPPEEDDILDQDILIPAEEDDDVDIIPHNVIIQDDFSVRGNSAMNIVNGGYAAISGEYIYYTINYSTAEIFDDEGIYRMRSDGSETIKLNNDRAFYLNIVDDWVYYRNGGSIFRTRADGTGRRERIAESIHPYNMSVVDGWIYYTPQYPSDYAIYKMSLDGSEIIPVTDIGRNINSIGEKYINVIGDWIYYQANISDNNSHYKYNSSIRKVRTDGSDNTEVYGFSSDNEWIGQIYVFGGYIFMNKWSFGGYSGATMHRINLDGSGLKQFEKRGIIKNINTGIDGTWIYYDSCMGGHGSHDGFYKMRIDGSEDTELSSQFYATHINIVGDRIFYKTFSSHGFARLDWTEHQLLSENIRQSNDAD